MAFINGGKYRYFNNDYKKGVTTANIYMIKKA